MSAQPAAQRPLACRLASAAAVACALLSATTVTFWVRSQHTSDIFNYGTLGETRVTWRTVTSRNGRVRFSSTGEAFQDPQDVADLAQRPPAVGRRAFTYRTSPGTLALERIGQSNDTPLAQAIGLHFGTSSRQYVTAPGRQPATVWRWGLALPYNLLLPAFAAYPLFWLYRWDRRRRRTRPPTDGLCAHCGYDLRATPTRCPECGAAAGHDARAAPDNLAATPVPAQT